MAVHRSRLSLWLGLVFIVVAVNSCTRSSRAPERAAPSPTAPTMATGASAATAAAESLVSRPNDVAFPPRNEPFEFGTRLEGKYRDQLRAPAVPSFVNLEGYIVWIQEYLRYRVNGCDHPTAIQRVFSQIEGLGVAVVCGSAPSGGDVSFPPRNEPFDFGTRLSDKYRDQLRATAVPSFVNLEGYIVWIQEYLRYRVNSCGHEEAVQRVFTQMDGGGVQPTCQPQVPCVYNFNLAKSVTAPAGSSTVTVTRTSGTCGWTATSNASFITLTKASGDGGETLNFNYTANSATASRTGTIAVQWSGGSATVTVTQDGTAPSCSIALNPSATQNVVPGGASLTVNVTAPSGCGWTASAASGPPSWVTITSGASGQGNGTVAYNATPNNTTSTRTGSITVQGTSGGSATLQLSQGPNAVLVARPGGPYGPVNAGTSITFNGLTSTSSPFPISRYIWDCGQTGNTTCSKEGGTASFTYVKQGSIGTTSTYTVTLTIEDTAGNRNSATTTVRVSNVY